jgi:hypothetical protein
MRNCYLLRLSPLRRVSACLFALPILILAFADSVFAQTSAGPTAPVSTPGATQPPSRQSLEDWHRGMVKVAPPKKGCFTSSYPSTQWQEVPCTTAPAGPYLPARGPRLTTTAGNGFDVVAQVTGHISETIGSFDSVTGVTSESGSGASPFGGPNSFSLQLNSNFFPNTPACTGGAATCKLGPVYIQQLGVLRYFGISRLHIHRELVAFLRKDELPCGLDVLQQRWRRSMLF